MTNTTEMIAKGRIPTEGETKNNRDGEVANTKFPWECRCCENEKEQIQRKWYETVQKKRKRRATHWGRRNNEPSSRRRRSSRVCGTEKTITDAEGGR